LAGFTLIEMAVSLIIITLLIGTLLVPLQTQVLQRKISDTQRTLDQTMEALYGYAAANGRLPCPASATSNGSEDCAGTLNVANQIYNGFFPAAMLGLSPADAQGYLVDAWGLQQNRIRYSVTNANGGAFITANGMRSTTMATLAPNLTVCSTATGIAGGNCAAGTTLTNTAPVIIFSVGPNAATTEGTGADEAQNIDGDRVFVWHTPAGSNAPNGEFDDIMTWISPNVLYSRMISAAQLP